MMLLLQLFSRPSARQDGRASAGTVAIEMAFLLPAFLLFLYGILELSHYAFTEIALGDAARLGARYAMVRGATSSAPATASSIASYVKGEIGLVNPNDVTVETTWSPNNDPGSVVTVETSYPFVPYLPDLGGLFGTQFLPSLTVTGSSEMTVIQ